MNFMEERLFEDLSISNFLKSWLIFYRFGLQDPYTRILLMTGRKLWEEIPANNFGGGNFQRNYWIFNPVFCSPPEGELSVEEASFEMKEYFEYWLDYTLNNMQKTMMMAKLMFTSCHQCIRKCLLCLSCFLSCCAQEKILYAFHACTYEVIRKYYLKNKVVYLEYQVNVV